MCPHVIIFAILRYLTFVFFVIFFWGEAIVLSGVALLQRAFLLSSGSFGHVLMNSISFVTDVELAVKRENYLAKQALKGNFLDLEDSDDDDNKREATEQMQF
jgi:hypothetical protein